MYTIKTIRHMVGLATAAAAAAVVRERFRARDKCRLFSPQIPINYLCCVVEPVAAHAPFSDATVVDFYLVGFCVNTYRLTLSCFIWHLTIDFCCNSSAPAARAIIYSSSKCKMISVLFAIIMDARPPMAYAPLPLLTAAIAKYDN